jgi:hypothetical protein
LKGKTSKVVVEFDSVKIRPLPFFPFFFECYDFDGEHRYKTLIEEESELLSYDHSLVDLN